MSRPIRSRRTVLAVPGSSEKMLAKAQTLDADSVFLDLEDAVAPAAKEDARAAIVKALLEGDWTGKTVTVRINDASTAWAFEDLETVVAGAGSRIDCIMLPKVERLADLHWLDTSLDQLEQRHGLERGRIGIEVQIEGPSGLSIADELAGGSPRVETLIFGPGDFMASMQLPSLTIGENSLGGYAPLDTVFVLLAIAARKHGVQVIDGPYGVISDLSGFEKAAERAVAFGFDGKWVLHPSQIDAGNRIFAPQQASYDRAEQILETYAFHTSEAGGGRGAVMLGDEMIDEASRKMAEMTALKGRRAGLIRTLRDA
ncbi:HpcH/HpaI aldolase/citrate lyase family protein [Microbacterium sp. CH12i]|uniref:HpcH/HpaI aldolase/citrate lyase family protein n=1 Tax=Microbacterium sp. CH12i TaxID=1479651 RepID=UPI0005612240|nr:CoA ester lyase [Microbacterium sp. CH12i]